MQNIPPANFGNVPSDHWKSKAQLSSLRTFLTKAATLPPVLANTTILTVQQEDTIQKVPYFNCARTPHTNYAVYGKHIKYLYDLLTISLTISLTLQLLPSFIERNGFWNKPHQLRDKSIESMQGHGLASFLFHHQTTCNAILEYIRELCCCGPLLLLQLTREREKRWWNVSFWF